MAVSSSSVYLASTVDSIAREDTVRMAVMFYDAMDALWEKRLSMSLSILVSTRIRV